MKGFVFLFGSILFLTSTAFYFKVPENDKPEKIDISISDSVTHEVNPLLYGFSCDNLYTEITNPYDTAFLKMMKQLGPKVLRWPGGSYSNYVHALEKGYGYVKSQVQNADIRTSIKMERQNVFNTQSKSDHPYLLDFIQLVKFCDAKVLLVANIVTGTPEECIDQIKFFRENGVEVIGVELGNELYMPNLRNVFRFPGSYMVKANLFTTVLRKNLPGIKIGVCAAPYNKTGDVPMNNTETNFFKSWNDAISRDNNFDAISIHYYLPVPVKTGTTIDSVFQAAVKDLAWQYSPGGLVSLSMDYYSKIFPKNKFWFSEWNIAPQLTQEYYYNTLFQEIYIQKFLHFLNSYNAQHNNQIETACFSSLATGGRSANSGVITLRESKENLEGTFIKRAAFFGFENIKPLFDSLIFLNETKTSVTDNIWFHTYQDTATKTISVYWSNLSDKEYTPGNIVAGKDTLSSDYPVTVRYFFGNLSSSYGFARFSRVNSNNPPERKSIETALSNLSFPVNSFGYFSFKVDSVLVKQ